MTLRPRGAGLGRAFEEVRFGRERILDLHALPATADVSADRVDRWLRERQVARSDEVLIITGRGAHSPDGESVVREAVLRRLHALRRGGVVGAIAEQGAGAFIVRLAPVRSLLEAPRRRRGPAPVAAADAPTLAALDPGIRGALRGLAELSLRSVGIQDPPPAFIEDEMMRQFSRLARTAAGSEAELERAIAAATDEYRDE